MSILFKYRFIFLMLACLTTVLVYWSGLNGPLVLDDATVLSGLISNPIDQNNFQQYIYSTTGPLGRSVSMLSFIVNAFFSQDIFYWKLVNLVIHVLCAVLIYFTLDQLIRIKKQNNLHSSKLSLVPLCIAIIWMLHPLHVSTVLYLVQRMTQLSALFVLLGLWTYLVARQRQINSQPFFWYQVLTWGVCFPLGLFSKESALLFPVFIFLMELFYIQSHKISNKNMFNMMTISLVAGVVFCFIKTERILGGYARREFSLVERLLTESRVLIDYLGMLLLPAQRNMGFYHDDFVISKSLLDPWTTLASLLSIFGLLSFAFYIRKKVPLASFGIVFFFAAHLLESTIISLELVFEHRNYLPSLGIFMAVAGLLQNYIENKKTRTVVFWVSSVILLLITFTRVDTWSSKMSLDYYINMVHPKSERMASKLASEWSGYGKYELARKKLLPFNSLGVVIHRLDIDCLERNTLTDDNFDIDMSPYRVVDNYVVRGLADIANAGLDERCQFSAAAFITFIDKALSKTVTPRSNRQIVLIYKAHFLWRLQRQQEAFDTLAATFKLDTANPIPLFMACEWMLDINDHQQVDAMCNKALSVATRNMSKYGASHKQITHRLNLKR